jgi:hypothetical protein
MLATMLFTWWTVAGGGVSPIAAITEAWVQIAIGFTLNFALNMVLLPMLPSHPHIDAWSNLWMGWCYTLVSLLRSYGIRRWLAAPLHNFAVWLGTSLKR